MLNWIKRLLTGNKAAPRSSAAEFTVRYNAATVEGFAIAAAAQAARQKEVDKKLAEILLADKLMAESLKGILQGAPNE